MHVLLIKIFSSICQTKIFISFVPIYYNYKNRHNNKPIHSEVEKKYPTRKKWMHTSTVKLWQSSFTELFFFLSLLTCRLLFTTHESDAHIHHSLHYHSLSSSFVFFLVFFSLLSMTDNHQLTCLLFFLVVVIIVVFIIIIFIHIIFVCRMYHHGFSTFRVSSHNLSTQHFFPTHTRPDTLSWTHRWKQCACATQCNTCCTIWKRWWCTVFEDRFSGNKNRYPLFE